MTEQKPEHKHHLNPKQTMKADLASGFSVSLIALPLCLGIAIASGAPPLAGLITAIVGGLIGSRISGTFVTISGPAAGLIVVILGAVETLGGAGSETGYAGYPHALGAIVIAGIIMALFGVLKVGKVGDFFPSAAVHGMLAAIGVIIMIKQLFPAIGVKPVKASILATAGQIPSAIPLSNIYAVAIAMATIAILVIHPKIKWKPIKMIPAPMWVMIITIALAHLFGGEKLELVQMPKNLFGDDGFTFPSFEKIRQGAFWSAVVGISLVAAIESLLSAKAVDALDPLKRKSNLDKDLLAMGSSSSIAALIGGLPMISEIVRSSANVNNGGKTQWANFFHGAFLLVFLLLASTIIELIPLSALAAMLVYTGFGLAAPKHFVHMYKIGSTEIIVFTTTLIAVLATDLIVGIGIGILCNYLFLIINKVDPRNLFTARVTSKSEPENNVLILEGAFTFSNYLGLKKRIDNALDEKQKVRIVLSGLTYIDHTTIARLNALQRAVEGDNKIIDLEGLELLEAATKHPQSERRRKHA